MTFRQFEGFFKAKYPQGMAVMHGKYGGTEKNMKVAVTFTPEGRVYEYYGSYQSILRSMGINVFYREDLERAEQRLADLREQDGKPDPFFGVLQDNSAMIAELEKYLEESRGATII